MSVAQLEQWNSKQFCILTNHAFTFRIVIHRETEIPPGIALTEGLKENIFMTVVCALSLTPLVIVGPPGSSKVRADDDYSFVISI